MKRLLIGICCLAVAGTAFAAPTTPEALPQIFKDKVLFQGKWREVPPVRSFKIPLAPDETVAQVEKLVEKVSADRTLKDWPPCLMKHDNKLWLVFFNWGKIFVTDAKKDGLTIR